MPYIEKTGPKAIKEQLYQWYGVMTDPRIDGFNGWGCKQKIYEIKMECERLLQQENCPTYAGEQEWLQEKKDERAVQRLSGESEGVPLVP
tara:strand:+ start:479 stop:748 length:270 start_codon:yes stop_codon:yes gene_type:complete